MGRANEAGKENGLTYVNSCTRHARSGTWFKLEVATESGMIWIGSFVKKSNSKKLCFMPGWHRG